MISEPTSQGQRPRDDSKRGVFLSIPLRPVLAAVALAGIAGWLLYTRGAPDGPPLPSTTAGEADGVPAAVDSSTAPQEIYAVHCSPCHGPQGLGDGPLADVVPVRPANIQEHMDHHTEVDLARLILEGIPPGMPPAPISEDDAARLVRYLLAITQ